MSILFCALVAIVFTQVIARYVFNSPFAWAEEVARSFFMWVVFVGIGLLVRSKHHISVNFIESLLPQKWVKISAILIQSFIFMFSIILIYYGLTTTISMVNQTTPILNISRSYTYIAIPIGGLLALVYSVLNIVDEIKGEVGSE